MNKEIWSYPKVYALGHRAIQGILDGPVTIQEKYDGSQLSWAWIEGTLCLRSKGKQQIGLDSSVVPDTMFVAAIDYLSTVTPIPDYVFRGEWFTGPKHNTLMYDRRPNNGLVLYDAEHFTSPSAFWNHEHVEYLANELGIEFATTEDAEGVTLDDLIARLELPSSLGGRREGVVVKNYNQFADDNTGKIAMGKVVSEDFREKHQRDWKVRNPNNKDVVESLVDQLNTEARWQKAIQHLRDDGLLTNTSADIGPLLREIKRDTLEEEREWILDQLAKQILPKVERGLGRGFPEWFKQRLAERAR